MRHDKIIKREDGSRVQINVVFLADLHNPIWKFSVSFCESRKRKFVPVINTDDYTYRRMTTSQRTNFNLAESLKLVSKDEIEAAMLELWEKVRPRGIVELEKSDEL